MRPGFWFFLLLLLSSCSSKYLRYGNPEQLAKIEEFDRAVKIEAAPEAPEVVPTENLVSAPQAPAKKTLTRAKKIQRRKDSTVIEMAKRQPDIEDDEGFDGRRRPLVDPFRVGEKVKHEVHYFGATAGYLTFKIDPFVMVNDRKSYQFVIAVETAPFFSRFYSVDDRAITLVDYEDLVPWVFTLHVKESGQLREGKSYFDFTSNRARYWERKVTEKAGVEEKRQEWEILPWSQNVFSSLFYMRVFRYQEGKTYRFRVADDEENLVFAGKVLRREKLKTKIGEIPAVVIKPEFTVKGIFKPVGDILIWLSDDDRKLVLRIESAIRIGTLVSEVIEIDPGQTP